MEHYTKIDMATWPRREHYRYYSQTLKVEFNMTAPVNVKNLLGFCRANGYRFYPAAIYCVTRTLGRIENFRMFRNADGELCVWDISQVDAVAEELRGAGCLFGVQARAQDAHLAGIE